MQSNETTTARMLREMSGPNEPNIEVLKEVALRELATLSTQLQREEHVRYQIMMARLDVYREAQRSEKSNQRLGLWLGGVISLAGLLVAYKLVVEGELLLGGVVTLADFTLLIGTVIFGYKAEVNRLKEAGATMLSLGEGMAAIAPLPGGAVTTSYSVALEERALEELVKVFYEQEMAMLVLVKAGFPIARIPVFTTAATFWAKVVLEAQNGILPGGIRRIIEVAAREYPDNGAFAAMARREHEPA